MLSTGIRSPLLGAMKRLEASRNYSEFEPEATNTHIIYNMNKLIERLVEVELIRPVSPRPLIRKVTADPNSIPNS